MSKRLVRIGAGKIYPALDKLRNHEISAILDNGKTYFGRLLSFTSDSLLLRDTRDHTHDIRLTALYEIVYDAFNLENIK